MLLECWFILLLSVFITAKFDFLQIESHYTWAVSSRSHAITHVPVNEGVTLIFFVKR